ncbi:BamA/TamA family outer membrane protein [Cyanobium sp. Candia 9D4]|uniref:BamA/TamA family outer membrane protein n=1 Tax=Cyanobium sp. Candia 9D4 TaxID=2823707 RepID=UPI0020CC9DA4|nr:BamA/TamA family outer membrane protein [Cyanobium sp. Candia 9D4]MCP9934412.1 BamA/TamA family outer membrane protein [Cyanobium sp. Candia 9D4]
MIGVRLGRPHILRSVTPRAATASLPLLVALLLAGGQARAAESPPGQGQTPVGSQAQPPTGTVAQAGADPFADPPEATPPAGATPVTPAPGATPASPAPAPAPAPTATPGATPGPPAASDDRPGRPSLAPAPAPSASAEPRVLISEVVIEGLADHPEAERLELAAYGAMVVTPGNSITRSELERDLQAIYATGWFSDVRIQPQDGPLGVRLVVSVVPNPVLTKVSLDPADAKVPETVVQETFAGDYGKTLNLVTLQGRMQELQKWYADQGFSLARVTGPSRIGPDGDVQLLVRQGTVKGVEVQFLNKEGSATNDKGQPIKGKTKEWVITREISIKTGEIFNRRNLEDDLKRLYGTGLFSDVKVTLRPEPEDPGSVVIVLGVVEQSTGSLSGGLGYSQSQGVFGQIQVQDSNLFGRAWDLSTSFTYGQFGGLADISFSDPWIKGDKYRTAFRFKAFVSRDAPQVFQSQNNGNFFTVSDFYQAPGTEVAYNIFSPFNPLLEAFPSVTAARIAAETSGQNLSWFQFDGNSVLIQRVGANVQFVRPLNGGNPFKRAPWTVLLGLTGQVATPMDFSGTSRRFALATPNEATSLLAAPTSSIICVAYNCAARNQLVGLRLAATMSTLNDPRNPTQGNFLSIGTEQFFSVGPDSPTFNRIRGSFTHYIPVRWLKFYKGCRPKAGETEDCKQALAFQVSAGTVIGDLPPYEAFCLGGGNSVRGYFDCDLGVGRSFGEATIEYRFPLFSIVSGELFIDGGTTFGSQAKVPGNLGGLLNKPGSGFSIGTGLIVTTPVGPLRLEVASQDFTGEWRFNLGVGWKF